MKIFLAYRRHEECHFRVGELKYSVKSKAPTGAPKGRELEPHEKEWHLEDESRPKLIGRTFERGELVRICVEQAGILGHGDACTARASLSIRLRPALEQVLAATRAQYQTP